MNTLAILLLLATVQHAIRNYADHGTNYTAEFTYDDSVYMVTLVGGNYENQAHYTAIADLYRAVEGGKLLIATNIPCEYTPKGCFEDSLEALFYKMAQQSPVPISAAKVGAALHFTPMTTAQGLAITNLDTETTYITVSNLFTVTRQVVPPDVPPITTNMIDVTVPVTVIGDWYLKSSWLLDPSTNIDSATHLDTNVISTNLVIKSYYRGNTNWWNLEDWPVTNIFHKWHWDSQKVYDN